MNQKGVTSNLLIDTVIHLVLVVLFAAGLFIFLQAQKEGAARWEDYYAKEITKVINLAQPGDSIVLEVHKATEIAEKNDVDFAKIFEVDNSKQEVCVRLSYGRRSCYGYFNNVDVLDQKLKLGLPANSFTFRIAEREARQ